MQLQVDPSADAWASTHATGLTPQAKRRCSASHTLERDREHAAHLVARPTMRMLLDDAKEPRACVYDDDEVTAANRDYAAP